VPRAKQKLRDVQEVLAERETQIGLYYESRENYSAAIARLETVVDTYPLYSKSDQALLGIGDAYAGDRPTPSRWRPTCPAQSRSGCAPSTWTRPPQAYAKVITRYPMAPHVEDARDRLVAMNRPVPEPTQEAVAENDAEERSRQPCTLPTRPSTSSSTGPRWLKPCTWANPRSTTPSAPWRPTSPSKTSSDAPSSAPLQLTAPAGGTGVGAEVVSAPAADPNAVIQPVGPDKTVIPAAEKPADAPGQVNDVKPGSTPAAATNDKKKPKVDSGDESSSKKKKKKGLSKLNPF
jgi:outer membrane protein assembly factor BamD